MYKITKYLYIKITKYLCMKLKLLIYIELLFYKRVQNVNLNMSI